MIALGNDWYVIIFDIDHILGPDLLVRILICYAWQGSKYTGASGRLAPNFDKISPPEEILYLVNGKMHCEGYFLTKLAENSPHSQ